MLTGLAHMPAGVQAMAAVGTVTADDYARVFAPLVARARQTGTRMRLLYQFGPDFERITPGALSADARLGVDYARLLDGCAVVSDIGWIRTPTRSTGGWMPCPVRVYDNHGLDDAIAWLTALPTAADVSARDMVKAYVGGVAAGLGSLGRLVISTGAKNHLGVW